MQKITYPSVTTLFEYEKMLSILCLVALLVRHFQLMHYKLSRTVAGAGRLRFDLFHLLSILVMSYYFSIKQDIAVWQTSDSDKLPGMIMENISP